MAAAHNPARPMPEPKVICYTFCLNGLTYSIQTSELKSSQLQVIYVSLELVGVNCAWNKGLNLQQGLSRMVEMQTEAMIGSYMRIH